MAAATKTPGRPFAILEGILPINARQVPLDIVAGITLAALAIPEVMGYTESRACRWSRASTRS